MLVALLPYFPTSGSMARYNVNFVFLAIVLLALAVNRILVLDRTLKKVIFFFIVLQLFLILSYLFGLELFNSVGDIGSLLRPVVVALFIVFFYQGYSGVSDYQSFYNYLKGLSGPIILISVLYVIVGGSEVILGDFKFINFLYKRAAIDKSGIEYSATTFMGSTYPSAFLGFFLLCVLAFINQFINRKRISLIIFLLMVTILFTQSKPFILLSFFYYIAYLVFSRGKFAVYLFSVISFLLLVLFYSFFFEFMIDFLKVFELNSKAARSLLVMMTDTESSGTLNTRIEQIDYAIESVASNLYLVGAGLGRDIYLESWVSEVIYRYGFFGLTTYVAAYLFVTYKLFSLVLSSRKGMVFFGLFFWFSTLPISQLSGMMIENGKTMVLSAFMFSLIFFIINNNRKALKI